MERVLETVLVLAQVVELINDPAAPDVRTTTDVDCIVDVLSLGHYHQVEETLRKQGFKQSIEDTVICRWHYDVVAQT